MDIDAAIQQLPCNPLIVTLGFPVWQGVARFFRGVGVGRVTVAQPRSNLIIAPDKVEPRFNAAH